MQISLGAKLFCLGVHIFWQMNNFTCHASLSSWTEESNVGTAGLLLQAAKQPEPLRKLFCAGSGLPGPTIAGSGVDRLVRLDVRSCVPQSLIVVLGPMVPGYLAQPD